MRAARVRPAPSAPAPAGSLDPAERTAVGLLGIVVTQASFLVAIMYYLGAVYLTAFYHYFRLDSFSLGFGFAETAIQSLNVVTAPAGIVCTLMVLAVRHLATREETEDQGRLAREAERALRAVAGAHLYIVGVGLLLLLLISRLAPYEWTAPLLLAVGVYLGQTPWASGGAAPPPKLWSKAVPAFTAGLLMMWALTLATGELGKREAGQTTANLVRRTSAVILSTDRLSLGGPGVQVTDLGAKWHYRYRYTGLRRLIERNGRYYLLPVGWNSRTDATYIIQDSDSLRVELLPGTQQP